MLIPKIKNVKLSEKALKSIIVIGASTGGTEATIEVLKYLPEKSPGIIVVQHMIPGFTAMYADRLNAICAFDVREAQDGDVIRPGLALVAPAGENHIVLSAKDGKNTVKLMSGEKISGHRPSVDVAFHSAAKSVGPKAIGIILTGMGQDGAVGLVDLRRTGAFTIGQDKDSSVVYGMPKVAFELGGVCVQSPLNSISDVLINHLLKL